MQVYVLRDCLRYQTKRLTYVQEPCSKNTLSTSKYSRHPTIKTSHCFFHTCATVYAHETYPNTSLLVPVGLQSPPSAVGPLRLNSEACREGGR